MAVQVVLFQFRLRHGNHRRAGTEADQRGRGGMNHVKAGNGRSGCCWSRFDANRFVPVGSGGASLGEAEQVFNHAREGTVPDQRGRCGMNRGLAGSVTSRCDRSCCVRAWRGVIDHGNHARAGTGLDQRQRRGMDFGLQRSVALGCVAAWRVELGCGKFGCGMAWLLKPPRGRRGSGFDAGWWDRSGYGQARQGTAGRGPSWRIHHRGRHGCGFDAAWWR